MKVVKFIIVAVIIGCCALMVSCEKAELDDDIDIIVSNVFTPNGDRENDVFEVSSKSGKEVELKIFTRAGVLVFSIKAERCRWDGYSLSGKPLANGIYYYTATTEEIAIDGFVYLYR